MYQQNFSSSGDVGLHFSFLDFYKALMLLEWCNIRWMVHASARNCYGGAWLNWFWYNFAMMKYCGTDDCDIYMDWLPWDIWWLLCSWGNIVGQYRALFIGYGSPLLLYFENGRWWILKVLCELSSPSILSLLDYLWYHVQGRFFFWHFNFNYSWTLLCWLC